MYRMCTVCSWVNVNSGGADMYQIRVYGIPVRNFQVTGTTSLTTLSTEYRAEDSTWTKGHDTYTVTQDILMLPTVELDGDWTVGSDTPRVEFHSSNTLGLYSVTMPSALAGVSKTLPKIY